MTILDDKVYTFSRCRFGYVSGKRLFYEPYGDGIEVSGRESFRLDDGEKNDPIEKGDG